METLKYNDLVMTYSIVFLLCIIILLNACLASKESFENKESVFTSNRLNFEKALPNYNLVSIIDKTWEYLLYKLSTGGDLSNFGKATKLIMDPMDYNETAKQFYHTPLTPGYFCMFTSPSKKDTIQCGFDLSSKKIGYFDRCEKRFIESIAFGYRTSPSSIKSVSFEQLGKIDSLWNEIDILVLYLIPKSPFIKYIEAQNLVWLDVSNISMDRLKLTHLYLNKVTTRKDRLFSIRNRIVTPGNVLTTIRMPLFLVDTKKLVESFITRLETSEPEFSKDGYRCFGDPTAVTEEQCMSSYDKLGEKKQNPTIWDRPCKTDEECPYFKANKNYENNFGKCLPDGNCEMPIGVSKMGYRKAYAKGMYSPFCYRCKNPKDTMCCEDQSYQVIRKQTLLKSPDYAFPNDTELRKQNKLPTYIPLLK